MSNSLDAKKRHRQSLVRRDRNRSVKSRVRSCIRAVEAALAAGDREAAEKRFRLFVKSIDTAAGKKVYHPNTAARKKSRLSKKLSLLVLSNKAV